MTFDLNAPPRQAVPFDRPLGQLANIVIFGIFDDILQSRRASSADPALVQRHDFVHNGSRMALVSTVTSCGTETEVTVTYSASPLEALYGLIATQLRWMLRVDVVMGDGKFTCTLPPEHSVDSFVIGPRLAPSAPDPNAKILAEIKLATIVGGEIRAYKQGSYPFGRKRHDSLRLDDPVYGVVGLDYEVKHTLERLPGEKGKRTHHNGEVKLRLSQANLVDLLPEMVDLAAFAREHRLVLIRESDAYCVWTFRFQCHPVAT